MLYGTIKFYHVLTARYFTLYFLVKHFKEKENLQYFSFPLRQDS